MCCEQSVLCHHRAILFIKLDLRNITSVEECIIIALPKDQVAPPSSGRTSDTERYLYSTILLLFSIFFLKKECQRYYSMQFHHPLKNQYHHYA